MLLYWPVCKVGTRNLPDLLSFSNHKIELRSFLAQLSKNMHDFPPKGTSQILPFYPLLCKMHHILVVFRQ